MNFLDRLSYQLFSARKFPPLSGQLATLSKLGYEKVEPFGALFSEADKFKLSLDANGLITPTSHFGIDMMRSDLDRAVAIAKRFDVSIMVVPYLQLPDRPKDNAGWATFGRELQSFADRLKPEGLKVAWHNHDFELTPSIDGMVPMDLILDAAPDVLWEPDIGWIVRAGADPLPWLLRYQDRVKAVHIKDLAPSGTNVREDGWADIGHGVIDWKRLVPVLAATDAQVFVVEHDNPSDFDKSARRSRESVADW